MRHKQMNTIEKCTNLRAFCAPVHVAGSSSYCFATVGKQRRLFPLNRDTVDSDDDIDDDVDACVTVSVSNAASDSITYPLTRMMASNNVPSLQQNAYCIHGQNYQKTCIISLLFQRERQQTINRRRSVKEKMHVNSIHHSSVLSGPSVRISRQLLTLYDALQ